MGNIFDNVFEVYKFCRSELDFEYARINDRMNWLLVSHAFLFTVLATLNGKPSESSYLYMIISFLGMVSAGTVSVGISGAKLRICDVKKSAKFAHRKLTSGLEGGDGVDMNMVPSMLPDAHKLGGLPSAVMPSLLTGVWGFIALRGISYNYSKGYFLVYFGYLFIILFLIFCLVCFSFAAKSVTSSRENIGKNDEDNTLKHEGEGEDENGSVRGHCPDIKDGYVYIFFVALVAFSVALSLFAKEVSLGVRGALIGSWMFVVVSVFMQLRMVQYSK
ncbi:hypothetical protein K9F62_11300 [Desulfovibrio sp. JY]|nr:hypothetical protein K9F62_11300 [Desulfovibrio sp. JY]